MELGRRAFLKLGGGAVVAGTGYAGYEEATGGKWLFDPETLTAARNKFFALADFATMREALTEYTPVSNSDLQNQSSQVDPTEIDQFAAVGSASISGHNGVPTSVLAGAVAGSFDASLVEDPAENSQNVEQAGTDGGYNLWEAEVPMPGESASNSSSEFDFSVPNIGLGTRDGASVAGAVRAPEAQVESLDAVRQMISAKSGGVGHARYLTADGDYESIRSQFDSNPTFLFGGIVDPAIMAWSTALSEIMLSVVGEAAGPAGAATDVVSAISDILIEELSAGAVGGNIDMQREETVLKAFLTYSTVTDAESTGIVQIVNAIGAETDVDGLIELDARYQGRSVVVRLRMENQAFFEQAQNPPETTPIGSQV